MVDMPKNGDIIYIDFNPSSYDNFTIFNSDPVIPVNHLQSLYNHFFLEQCFPSLTMVLFGIFQTSKKINHLSYDC